MATNKEIFYGGVLGSGTDDGKLVITDNIYDDDLSKFQSEINAWIKQVFGNNGPTSGKDLKALVEDILNNGVLKDAPEAFDTLKEIADWIGNHDGTSGAISDITELKKLVAGFSSNASDVNLRTIKAYVDSKATSVLTDWQKSYLAKQMEDARILKVASNVDFLPYNTATTVNFSVEAEDGTNNAKTITATVDGTAVTVSNKSFSKSITATKPTIITTVKSTLNTKELTDSLTLKVYAPTYCGFCAVGNYSTITSNKVVDTIKNTSFSVSNGTKDQYCYLLVCSDSKVSSLELPSTYYAETNYGIDEWAFNKQGTTTINGLTYTIYRYDVAQYTNADYTITFKQ